MSIKNTVQCGILISAIDVSLLDKVVCDVNKVICGSGMPINISVVIMPRKKLPTECLLRSPFIYGDHKNHFGGALKQRLILLKFFSESQDLLPVINLLKQVQFSSGINVKFKLKYNNEIKKIAN